MISARRTFYEHRTRVEMHGNKVEQFQHCHTNDEKILFTKWIISIQSDAIVSPIVCSLSLSLWVYLSQSNGKETKTRLNALIRDKRHKLCKWLNNRQPKNGKESQKRKNDNENRLEFGTTSSTFIPFCKVNRPFGCRTMEKTNILLRNDRQQKNGR